MSAPSPNAQVRLDAAVAHLARGDLLRGLVAWRAALASGLSPRLVARAGPLFDRAIGRPSGDGVPRPAQLAPPSGAWALAWAGDLAGARRLAEQDGESRSTRGLLGAIATLERRPLEALGHLDAALAGESATGEDSSEPLRLFRVRALVRLGRVDEAQQALGRLIDGESFARRAVHALASVRAGEGRRDWGSWTRSVRASETYMNGFYAVELPAVVAASALDAAFASPEALADALERLLDRMAGNLGPVPTFAGVAPDGRPCHVPAPIPRSTRAMAVDAIDAVRSGLADVAEARLTELHALRPSSPHPFCYRGELRLWLGRYQDALGDFTCGKRLAAARWADIGIVASLFLLGDASAAHAAAITAEQEHRPIPGGTLPVYRGALRRRTGDLAGAIDDLSLAVESKPSRIGARIELVLALRASRQGREAAPHAGVLLADASPILVDVADALGLSFLRDPAVLVSDEVLEGALRALRGNRSSSIVTWFSGGELRVLPTRAAIAAEAARLA